MAQGLKKMHSRHREILRLHILGWGMYEIANETGASITAIHNLVNSEMGKMVIEDIQNRLDEEAFDVSAQLYRNAHASEVYLGEIVQGREKVTPALRARVCMDQLDRAGYPKVTKQVSLDLHGQITAEEIAEIKDNVRRMKNVVTVNSEDSGTQDPSSNLSSETEDLSSDLISGTQDLVGDPSSEPGCDSTNSNTDSFGETPTAGNTPAPTAPEAPDPPKSPPDDTPVIPLDLDLGFP